MTSSYVNTIFVHVHRAFFCGSAAQNRTALTRAALPHRNKYVKLSKITSSKAVILAATEIFDVGTVGFADFKTVGELFDPEAGALGLT